MIKHLLITLFFFSDIYSFSVPAIGGGQINFNDLRGKKILIVNTASNSPLTSQYAGLETLYQQYKDSLVIIACPSNDFNHEAGSEADIQALVQNTYGVHFLVSGKTSVTGTGQSDLYKWLTMGSMNEAITNTVQNDFQKYLVNSDGHLLAYFAPQVDPMDSLVQNVIQGK